ncbi:hypothetical protein [Flavobacterium sp.]|uniref:hypothetical protein n=1 Tax=Flavobacterium sp. TaxID=239 RepID=UPI002604A826|nr:hypothetical protein [Flavobacterium sp.]
MKNLKLTIVISFLFLIASYNGNAQTANTFDDAKFEKNETLRKDIKKIDISSGQEVVFKEITKKYVIQYENLVETQITEAELNEKMKEIQVKKNAEMRNLLDDKQYEKYLEIQQERETASKNRIRG